MTLTDILILAPLATAFYVAMGTAAWWNHRVTVILKARHPEVWAILQGPILPKGTVFGSFLRGDQHLRLADPELSRAVRLGKVAGVICIVCLFTAFAALVRLDPFPR